MVHVVPPTAHGYRRPETTVDEHALKEAIHEAHEKLSKAEKPIIIAGVEIHRFGLQDQVVKLAEQAQIPISATLLGKSVIREKHPLYIGLYEGAMGRAEVTQFVEESDCVLLLGTFMTDINLGIYTAKLDLPKCIYVTSEQLQISHHFYHGLPLNEFLDGLIKSKPTPKVRTIPDCLRETSEPEFALQPDSELHVSRMMHVINDVVGWRHDSGG